MHVMLELFLTFLKIGLFTFGGGYAMLPLLKAELVTKKKWVSEDELLDYYAIGQCTPGIIAVNVSTFIGFRLKGIAGAIVTMLGIVTPSLVIIIALANILELYMENKYVMHAFAGIRIVVVALIFDVTISLWRKAIYDVVTKFIFLGALGLLIGLSISPVKIVVVAGILGLVLKRGAKV